MKQKKTLQILLLVFAGLIVLYTGVNLYQKQQSSKEDSDQTMISDLKSLTSISYNNNGTTLSFIKQNGKWYYTKNKKYPITQNGKTKTYTSKEKNLDGISGGLGVFTFGDCQNYYASQTDLARYGLDKDSRITVDITYKDTDTKKTKNVVLYIGKKDSDQKNYYVQLKGSHMVYLSDKDVVKNILNP